ncbi:hypothetical protein [Desulfobacula toluolica]|uniref:hypothetical protein n=1 Tax=Desulfobacula toluolica TaxID=28223 RepID=UPI0002EDE458|nr:hypothetical protein [Desulfobacula toluolica]
MPFPSRLSYPKATEFILFVGLLSRMGFELILDLDMVKLQSWNSNRTGQIRYPTP